MKRVVLDLFQNKTVKPQYPQSSRERLSVQPYPKASNSMPVVKEEIQGSSRSSLPRNNPLTEENIKENEESISSPVLGMPLTSNMRQSLNRLDISKSPIENIRFQSPDSQNEFTNLLSGSRISGYMDSPDRRQESPEKQRSYSPDKRESESQQRRHSYRKDAVNLPNFLPPMDVEKEEHNDLAFENTEILRKMGKVKSKALKEHNRDEDKNNKGSQKWWEKMFVESKINEHDISEHHLL